MSEELKEKIEKLVSGLKAEHCDLLEQFRYLDFKYDQEPPEGYEEKELWLSDIYEKAFLELFEQYAKERVYEAEQKPVGDAIEVQVPKETMQAVMARINLKPKTIAGRVLEPEWRIEAWIDGTADEYDLEVVLWKLKILADLTGKFNWCAFLLKPDNLDVLRRRNVQTYLLESQKKEDV